MSRSILYVPGDAPDKLAGAHARGADAIIADLEDAVAPGHKDEARRTVAAWLGERAGAPGPGLWVRVNSGDELAEDLRAVDGRAGIYVPKASEELLGRVDALLGDRATRVCALVETAAGVLAAAAIARAPRVVRLALGEADLGAELGIEPGAAELAPVRMQVVLASAAAGIEPPIGPVSTDFRDLQALRDSTEALRRMGFGGRAAIHPAQVGVINEVFTPAAGEVEAARRLLARFESAGGGVCVDEDGRMVDEAIVRAARRTLALAGEA